MKKSKQTIAVLSMLLFLIVINTNVNAQSFFAYAIPNPCGYDYLATTDPNPTDQWYSLNQGTVVWVGESYAPTAIGNYYVIRPGVGPSNWVYVTNDNVEIYIYSQSDTLCPPATSKQISIGLYGNNPSISWSPATGLNQTTGQTVLASPTVTTTYTVTVTSLSGLCTKTATVKIVVKPVPNPLTATNITASSAVANWSHISCATAYTVQYRVSGATTWTTKQVNTNTSSTTITGLLPNTKYQWKVKTKFSTGSSKYSASKTFKTLAARIGESTSDNNIRLFPNPTTGVFTVAMNDCVDCSYLINVYDILGNLVFTDKNTAEGESKSIDLSHLAKGIYQVQVNYNGVTQNSKLILE